MTRTDPSLDFLFIWAESAGRSTGGTSHLKGLLAGLEAIRVHVRVLIPSYKGQDRVLDDPRISYIPLPQRNLFSFLLLQMFVIVALPYWLIRYRPKAVYVRTCFLMFLMAPICRLARVPLIAEVDAIVDEEMGVRGQRRIGARLVGWLDRINYRSVTALACVTGGIRDEVIRRGGDRATTVHIPNATLAEIMQPQSLADARNALGLPADGYLVGFAGSMAAWQGFDLLIEAARRVISQSPGCVRFALMGHGQCQSQLESLIREHDLRDRFIILPPGPPERVATFFSACDAVAVTIHDPRTLRYGLSSLKFWDAVSIGVPVLMPRGSQLGGILDDLGLPGIYADGDADDLARTILQVIPQSVVFQEARTKTHEKVSVRYSWTQVAEQLVDLLKRLRNDGSS